MKYAIIGLTYLVMLNVAIAILTLISKALKNEKY